MIHLWDKRALIVGVANALSIAWGRSGASARAPMRRMPSVEDAGASAAFLCTDHGRCITGTVMQIDGGSHIMA